MFDAVTYAAAVSAAKRYTDSQSASDITKEYVDGQDQQILTEAKEYCNNESDKIATLYVEIMTEVGRLVCDHTAQEITAHSLGQVIAKFTDKATKEVRQYTYFKKMPDGRACFSKDGYIEAGIPKQTLFYVDYAGNVEYETRSYKESAIIIESVETAGSAGLKKLTTTQIKQYANLGTITDWAWVNLEENALDKIKVNQIVWILVNDSERKKDLYLVGEVSELTHTVCKVNGMGAIDGLPASMEDLENKILVRKW